MKKSTKTPSKLFYVSTVLTAITLLLGMLQSSIAVDAANYRQLTSLIMVSLIALSIIGVFFSLTGILKVKKWAYKMVYLAYIIYLVLVFVSASFTIVVSGTNFLG